MKESDIDRLIAKYKEGKTTLEQEQYLRENSPELEAWASYIDNNRIVTPEDLNKTLWESFETKKSNKTKLVTIFTAIAASLLLLLTLNGGVWGSQELSFEEKQALLEEAINMFPTQGVDQQDIIYENEMIIVYTTLE